MFYPIDSKYQAFDKSFSEVRDIYRDKALTVKDSILFQNMAEVHPKVAYITFARYISVKKWPGWLLQVYCLIYL